MEEETATKCEYYKIAYNTVLEALLIPSLLGMDILKNYEIKFNKNGVIIEK